jgi:hypothetical protein
MPPLAWLAAIFVTGTVLYGLGRAVLEALFQAGRSAERALEVERNTSILRRQSEIMLEKKDPANVEKDLDSGAF